MQGFSYLIFFKSSKVPKNCGAKIDGKLLITSEEKCHWKFCQNFRQREEIEKRKRKEKKRKEK